MDRFSYMNGTILHFHSLPIGPLPIFISRQYVECRGLINIKSPILGMQQFHPRELKRGHD